MTSPPPLPQPWPLRCRVRHAPLSVTVAGSRPEGQNNFTCDPRAMAIGPDTGISDAPSPRVPSLLIGVISPCYQRHGTRQHARVSPTELYI